MTGYVSIRERTNVSYGEIIKHGLTYAEAVNGRIGRYAFTDTSLPLQARVTFDDDGNGKAVNIVWDGTSYDVPPNQLPTAY